MLNFPKCNCLTLKYVEAQYTCLKCYLWSYTLYWGTRLRDLNEATHVRKQNDRYLEEKFPSLTLKNYTSTTISYSISNTIYPLYCGCIILKDQGSPCLFGIFFWTRPLFCIFCWRPFMRHPKRVERLQNVHADIIETPLPCTLLT